MSAVLSAKDISPPSYSILHHAVLELLFNQASNGVVDAFQALEAAAYADHALAQYHIGLCYLKGYGVEESHEMADCFFLKATRQWMHQIGEAPHQREQEQPVQLRDSITEIMTNGEILSWIGDCIFYGHGMEMNLLKAVHYYERSAACDAARGLWRLGECLLGGFGLEKDPNRAVSLLHRAAGLECTTAQYRYGVLLLEGGVGSLHRDIDLALNWITKSAEHGNYDAQHDLACQTCGSKNNCVATLREKKKKGKYVHIAVPSLLRALLNLYHLRLRLQAD